MNPLPSAEKELQPVHPGPAKTLTVVQTEANVKSLQVTCNEGEGSESDESAVAKSQPHQNAVSNAYSGRDGTLWYKSVPQVGRANAANVLQQSPGLPLQSRRVKTHLDSFLLFINPAMIRKILNHTNAEARRVNGDQFDFGLGEDEFLAFLGLLLARGVLCAKNEPLDVLWSRDYGCDIF